MSAKPDSPMVITANRLLEGDVVYLDAEGGWTPHLAGGRVFLVAGLAEARMREVSLRGDVVVGVYLADVVPGPDGPRPVHFREAFRAGGPTNYPHGKAHEVA